MVAVIHKDVDIPAITQITSPEEPVKSPVINWLQEDTSGKLTTNDISRYSDDKTLQLVEAIQQLGVSASFSSILLGFWATLFYRYTYQDELELQHLEINNPSTYPGRINFTDSTKLTVEEACQKVHEILLSITSEIKNSDASISSPFCLVETGTLDDSSFAKLYELFTQRRGKIWLIAEKHDEHFQLQWLYDNRINPTRIFSMQTHLHNLVLQAKTKPQVPFSSLAMLTEEEINQQLSFASGPEFQDEATPLYERIEQLAQLQPDKTAISCGDEKLSYAQLNKKANRLAHSLLKKNIEKGNTIAVYISPSVDIMVSILAIHKTGCTYVPVDPGFPSERVNAILNEINPRVILCDSRAENIPQQYKTICNRISDLLKTGTTDDNPGVSVSLDDHSHIYFTSGTTGKPKGVLATQGNLVHYISSAINRYKFNNNDRFIAAARFTFSISMFELMTPLVAGGELRVLPRESVLDLKILCSEVEAATVFHFGPSLLKQLLPYIEENYSSFAPFEKLNHVSSGGDMVPPEILEKLKKIFCNAEVFVIYGSSEISCMGCTYQAPRNKTITRTLVGRPMQNVKVRIFDNDGNMVPIGVPGQVYFAGNGLVKGYLHLPELTSEKFTTIDNERFYAIGDVGRFDDEGNLQLLGREDFQVQIRGMRVELLEIEACLKSHPLISDCVVVAKTLQGNDEKSLVAYVVPAAEKEIDINDVNSSVANQLPDYMIPAVYVKLDKLPTNHNAKLDRSQLPPPGADNILFSSSFEKASNPLEQELIHIWEELFKINNIGIDHNFFELGGDSLLAVSFLFDVDKRYDKSIPISVMYEAPTIREIAAIITSDEPIRGSDGVVVMRDGNDEPPLFLLYGVVLYRDLAESLDTDRKVCSVYFEEEAALVHHGHDSEEFQRFSDVPKISEQYLKAIRDYQPHGPYYLFGQSFGGILALEVARVLIQEGETVKLLAMSDTYCTNYMEDLPLKTRLALHWRQLRLYGWKYLHEKLSRIYAKIYTRLVSKGNDFDQQTLGELGDIHEQARLRVKKYYVPEPYYEDVLMFKARERSSGEARIEELGVDIPHLESIGWGEYMDTNKLEIHTIDGNHESMLRHGQVEQMSRILSEKMK